MEKVGLFMYLLLAQSKALFIWAFGEPSGQKPAYYLSTYAEVICKAMTRNAGLHKSALSFRWGPKGELDSGYVI